MDLVKDFLTSSDHRMTPDEFVAFVAKVRASLEGRGGSARGQIPASHHPEGGADAEAAARVRASGGATGAGGVEPGEPGLAVGLLREAGRTYKKQRNALTEGPAVSPEKSYTDEYIICLEDNERVKFLRRHLAHYYGMTIDEYRKKWGLPDNYPTVPKNYMERRRKIAAEVRGESGRFSQAGGGS